MKMTIDLLVRLIYTAFYMALTNMPLLIGLVALVIGLIWPQYYPLLLILSVLVGAYFIKRKPRKLIGAVEVPAHDAYLPGQEVQWWYWTGHLFTKEGRRFGFEVVFFNFDNFFKNQLMQAAVTDVENQRFSYGGKLRFVPPKLIKDSFDLTSGKGGKITAVGGDGKDKLHAEVAGKKEGEEKDTRYILDIDLESTKPVTMRYGENAHPYCFGGFTYYYSRTHMETKGTLTIDGEKHEVNGVTWFDRQYGELQKANFRGWQWFAIELEDNRQYMIFDFLGKDAEIEKAGGITYADGTTRDLYGNDFNVTRLAEWVSPHTETKYPSKWEVEVDGMTLIVEPFVPDQELSGGNSEVWVGVYWEGACSVTGDVKGQAYVELNGFKEPIRIRFFNKLKSIFGMK